MKNKSCIRKGRNGTGCGVVGDKMWGEVGQMRLSGLAVKTAPHRAVTGPEAPRQGQIRPDRVMSV